MKQSSATCGPSSGPELTVAPAPEAEPRPGLKSESARRIEQSIAFMMQHLNQPLQVAELAETAHTSPSHFFVLFKRLVGSSPIDYFIRLRMQRACRLLAGTALSVKEIAADLGYDDPFYFSRVFKSVHGLAPSDYRQMLERPKQKNGGPAVAPMTELLQRNSGPEKGSGAGNRIAHERILDGASQLRDSSR